jgi:hypothetical protein
MTRCLNVAGHSIDPVGVPMLAPGREDDVDLSIPHNQALLDAGSLAPLEPLPEPESFDVSQASEDELVAHLKGSRLTVPDTVALAGDDADLKARVLAAEILVSGGDPRRGVVDALKAPAHTDPEEGS